MQILNFLRFNISLQVKVMASEAAMTFTADSKADRKSAENTTFQHRPCAYFRRSPHGVKIRLFMKILSLIHISEPTRP